MTELARALRIKVTDDHKALIKEACARTGCIQGTKLRELAVSWACAELRKRFQQRRDEYLFRF